MHKVLVVCVDRDDDLWKKAKIKGPIVGKEANIEAAQKLLLADPAEADANTMFEAVKTFTELKKEAVEVVTLTGDPDRGYRADKTLGRQLDEMLKKYEGISGIYLITDGRDDDEIIPLIQTRTKLISKKTLIIKQAKELEKSYYVLKEVLRDPAFARLIFGLPGIILLIVAFLQELGVRLIILGVGVYLMFKGFGIEEPILNSVRGFRETTSMERASFPLYIGAALVLILALWSGAERVGILGEASILKMGAAFLAGFINLFVVAVILFFAGRMGDMHYQQKELQVRRYAMSIVTVLAGWIVITKVADLVFGAILLDEFIGWVVLAFLGSIVGLTIVRRLYTRRYVVARLKKDMEVFDPEGNKIGSIFEVSKKTRGVYVAMPKREEKLKIPFSQIILVKDFATARLPAAKTSS
jgi:putative membrane protein